MDQKIIGRKEKVTLPDLGLKLVWAKVDTGAYTSSIHAENLEVVESNGKRILQFVPLLPGHKSYTGDMVTFEQFREKKVKNSFGHAEVRYLIETTFELAGETFMAEFTLSDRSSMRNAILLGRKILRNRFLVDVCNVNMALRYRKK